MDFRLAREIYGQPWYVDSMTLQSMTSLLDFYRKGNPVTDQKKYNTFSSYDVRSEILDVEREFEKEEDEERPVISVIKIDGPITKHGGMSHNGMLDTAAELRRMDAKENVKGHILHIESGGGSAKAVEVMIDAMKASTKPIVAYVDDIMASAALHIGVFADYIYAHKENDNIGSVGTMIEMRGPKKVAEDKDRDVRYVRIYADDASEKNEEFEEAINNLNFTPIKEKILNPFNDAFRQNVREQRPNYREEELTGRTFFAREVVDTLIDEIGSFNDAVNKVLELSEGTSQNNNLNQEQMTQATNTAQVSTVQDLKANFSDLCNQIIKSERDRVEAYLEYVDVDAEAVKAGIKSGENPTQKFYAEMNRKLANNQNLKATENDSPEEVVTGKEPKSETPKSEEVKAFEKGMGIKEEEVA